jgi:ribosome maturation factor RimP
MDNRRIHRETGLEARIAHIVEPVVTDLGYELVRVKLSAVNRDLQIMASGRTGRCCGGLRAASAATFPGA